MGSAAALGLWVNDLGGDQVKELQAIIKVIPIEPDNEANIWGDYTHIIKLNIRLKPEEAIGYKSGIETFFLFGQKDAESKAVMKEIDESEAMAAIAKAIIGSANEVTRDGEARPLK